MKTEKQGLSSERKMETAPFTTRTAVQSTFPASLDTWHVNLAESLGFTEWSSKELDEASFLIKYEPPVEISFSSLNHLTTRGAVPVKADFKETVEPSFTSRLSGFTVKAGGSRKTMVTNSRSSSTYSQNGSLCSYTDQWYLNATFLTFDTESSSVVLLTSHVGQSASIIASIT